MNKELKNKKLWKRYKLKKVNQISKQLKNEEKNKKSINKIRIKEGRNKWKSLKINNKKIFNVFLKISKKNERPYYWKFSNPNSF